MLELKDFFHLPKIDELMDQVVARAPGLVVVAGLDPRPAADPGAPASFLPSGRSTLFNMLVRRALAARPIPRSIIISQTSDGIRVPRGLHRRVQLNQVLPPLTYNDLIADASRRRPDLIVVDQLNDETTRLALGAARDGNHVLSQVDCVFCGAQVTRHLTDLGASDELMQAVTWIITVQRLPTLCPQCKRAAPVDAPRLAELSRRFPDLPAQASFFKPGDGCDHCKHTGRAGDVMALDVFRAPDSADRFNSPSLLSMEEYTLQLAALGQIAIDDAAQLGTDQLRRTYFLLTASERALAAANTELMGKLAVLESANRVLQQRTESLVSLQEIAQTLITSSDPEDLANQVTRSGRKLCGADRSVLYVLRPYGMAEILAVSGWDPNLVHLQLNGLEVFGMDPTLPQNGSSAPVPFHGWPPGVPPRHKDVEGVELRAGLRVPLLAQNEVVGLMIVHSTHKTTFAPGETALLQTLANQAAMAIQRAGLIESLQDKVVKLQQAQVELVQKQRLERELELAREVQQSLLPRVFPNLPDYAFAVKSEAARRVGGDFYDVFQLDDEHLGLVIADVSDKGMPAALFMALTRSLLLAEARRELAPQKVLAAVHRLLLELGEPDMFVTVFYGVVDRTTRTLTYTRAGHEIPLLIRNGGMQSLSAKGTFLGVLDPGQLLLSEDRVVLMPGDRLVLYTDGLVDLLNPEEEYFGREPLATLLLKHARLAPQDYCERIFQELQAFQGAQEQFDDMALLVVDVK